jgi:hypothetical protein
MTQNTFTTMIRGFEVTVEAGDTEDMYKVHVVEGGGVPWTAELPIDLEGFVGENEDLDGSNELLTFVAEAAVDLFESSRDTLGQGAGALEVAAMKKRSQSVVTGCMGTPWQDYYLQLKDTLFAGKAEELIKQYLELSLEEPHFEKPELDELRKEKQHLIYDLNMLELELLKSSPEQQMILIVGGRKRAYMGEVDIPMYLDIFAGSPLESEAVNIMKGILDVEERIQSLEDSNEDYTAHWKRMNSIEMQLQDLILTAVEKNAPLGCPTGMDSAPNMANDIAELMEGVDLHTPLSASKKAFEETETAEEREIEGGEIRHDLDTGCIDPEDYKFEPNQKATLSKKLELMIGGGVPKTYDKGTSCVVESRYDGEGDFYYVRFEDGQMARVLFSDLTGGKKKEGMLFTPYDYMDCLLQLP